MTIAPHPIYFLRHGETEWNAERRRQGWSDSPLTPRGVMQARNMGATLLATLDPAVSWQIVASPQGRAACTAGIISGMIGLPLGFDARVREISLGSWEGQSWNSATPAQAAAWEAGPFASPDGESYDQIASRARDWLESVERPTILVSHGVFGKVLRGLYLNDPELAHQDIRTTQDGMFLLQGGTQTFIECIRHETGLPHLPAPPRANRMEPR